MVATNILALSTRTKRIDIADTRFRQAQLKAVFETLKLAGETRAAWINAVSAFETLFYLNQGQVTADAASELAKKLGESGALPKAEQTREHVFYSELTGQKAQVAEKILKEINDNLGHLAGDQLLVRIARRLENCVREEDMIARFGGDEFVALCLGCAPGDIEIPVSRLLSSISEIDLDVDGERVTVEASVGAAVRHSGFRGSLPEDLFVAADNCLYEAKKSSLNAWRVEFDKDGQTDPEPIACPTGAAANTGPTDPSAAPAVL